MSSFPPSPVQELVSEVAALLLDREETVSIAETVRSLHNHSSKYRVHNSPYV